MKDLVTKGTGNSRYMKSAIGASETWEQAREKLRNGTFPFDLNGLNEAGIEQMGMALSKQNLLSDNTAAALGLSGDPTVDDAFANLLQKILGRSQFTTGSYIGTGTYGSSNPCEVTFDFEAKLFMIFSGGYLSSFTVGESKTLAIAFLPVLTTSYQEDVIFPDSTYSNFTGYSTYSKKSSDGKTIYWYNTWNDEHQFNTSNKTYNYIAIG